MLTLRGGPFPWAGGNGELAGSNKGFAKPGGDLVGVEAWLEDRDWCRGVELALESSEPEGEWFWEDLDFFFFFLLGLVGSV